ncbi:Hvo_1808 family surface protein [Halorhabdus amylolytica]|uniref:Hvo_1808 family surface protein n=1 Tax=Halorhabdus amylolytica TaxID=2559573 RepID=UPI0010AA2E86|nr:Hvo_1808 family surface protein [Halorhabdus amylolytica]
MVARTHLLAVIVAVALVGVPVAAAVEPPQPASTGLDGSDAEHLQATNTTERLSTFADQHLPDRSSTFADQHSPDPEADILGWEAGYWYNESISVTPGDGLNDSELDAVVARGMARVEQIRRIEFEERPPVEIISRSAYEERVRNDTSNLTEAQRLHQNVKYEALLMVNESTDTTQVQADNQAGGVGGFYDPSTGEIKIVSENTSTPKMNEITLSQELFHALQDQRFDIASFNQSTQELHNARDGIIEGDGNYVDHLYQQHCENEWEGTCLMPEDSQGASSDFQPHFGLYQILLQPYSDGPPFVEAIREEGGWEAVNAVYENPPASTEQTIHPEKYDEDAPTNVSVPDRSDDRWRVLDVNGSINYASFGEAGLYVTLWYPSIDIGIPPDKAIIPYANHVNAVPGGAQQFDPYNYNHSYTAGWDGDKLVPYVTDESSETNETGYVYKTVWDSPEDAAEFSEGYERLLTFRGAEAVEGRLGTWRIPDGKEFGDAFYLDRTGETLVIVNAPNVEELPAVREGSAPEGERTPVPDDDDGTGIVTTTDGPGFTVLAAFAALLAFAVTSLRRR